MKKLLLIVALAIVGMVVGSCVGSDTEDKYKDWRKANDAWFTQQMGNSAYYKTVTAPWDPNGKVLMHWYNDTMLTRDNLKPLFTSGVNVKYRGMLYDSTPFDSSYLSTSPADSVVSFKLNANIEGFALGVMQMHVGDSCRVVVPYAMGYGSYSRGTTLKPYSTLVFDIKLQDIYAYEVKP